MAKVKTLRDVDGGKVYPITSTNAVLDPDGGNLSNWINTKVAAASTAAEAGREQRFTEAETARQTTFAGKEAARDTATSIITQEAARLTAVEGEVTELGSKVDGESNIIGIIQTGHGWINNSGKVQYKTSSAFDAALIIPVVSGEMYIYQGYAKLSAFGWGICAWVAEDGETIIGEPFIKSVSGDDTIVTELEVTAPSSAKYAVLTKVAGQGTLGFIHKLSDGGLIGRMDSAETNITNVTEIANGNTDDIQSIKIKVDGGEYHESVIGSIESSHGWINNSGKVQYKTSSAFDAALIIPVVSGEVYIYQGYAKLSTFGWGICAWVAEDGETIIGEPFIKSVSGDDTIVTELEVTAPSSAKYAVLTKVAGQGTLGFIHKKTLPDIISFENKTEQLYKQVNGTENSIIDGVELSHGWMNVNGTAQYNSSSAFDATLRISVKSGETYIYKGYAKLSAFGWGICAWVNEDNSIIGQPFIKSVSGDDTIVTELEVTAPLNAKYAVLTKVAGQGTLDFVHKTKGLVDTVSTNNLTNKRIAYFGDSLMAGIEEAFNYDHSRDISGGIWKRLNEKYSLNMVANHSEGGTIMQGTATIKGQTSPSSISNSISRKMYAYDNSNTDIILFTAGFNDAANAVAEESGTIANYSGCVVGTVTPMVEDVNDFTSVVASLESAICHLKTTNPYTKIVWIKCWHNGSEVYQQKAKLFYDGISAACDKWGVPIIDLWKNGNLNLQYAADRTVFGRINHVDETNISYDNVHLGGNGFDRLMPFIEKSMEMVI